MDLLIDVILKHKTGTQMWYVKDGYSFRCGHHAIAVVEEKITGLIVSAELSDIVTNK
jgi:hypothetical protein